MAEKKNGLLEKGNIDLSNRPVVENEDGTFSTVRSYSFQDDDGKEVLIPTVSDDGRILSDEEAIEQYKKTGKHLGKFATPEAATEYAIQLHNEQQDMYLDKHRINVLYGNQKGNNDENKSN